MLQEQSMIAGRIVLMLVALGSLAIAGCQRTTSLEGAVTYNGQPVEKGSIAFQPADGTGSGFGAEIVDGRFAAKKAQPGKYTVLVRGVHERVAPQSTEEAIRQYEEAKAAGKATLDHYGQPADYIPEDAEGNGKTIDVESGANKLDFALKGPPRTGS
jgi:hypothetical protein